MPTIVYRGQSISCQLGETLRDVLHRHGLSPHNHVTRLFNCHGMGTCGTCAVEVRGQVSPPTWIERVRLRLWPYNHSSLRLACKVRVLGNVEVVKYGGIWGQQSE